MKESLLQIAEPKDYFSGVGNDPLPVPKNLLLFLRQTKKRLQQDALQNRSHHRFVLAFDLETEGCVHVDNLTLPFRPGQALLIFPYQFHHFSQLASSELQWLFGTFELEPFTFLEPLRNRVIEVSRRTRHALAELMEGWHRPESELKGGQLQAALLYILLLLKEDRQQAATLLPPEPKDNLLRTVNRLLGEWRGRTVVVGDLARELRLSESRVRVLFKEAAGIPLGRYIRNYRINRAMALLRTTTLSIADVAEEAGFGSPQAFSRIFKKETGKTPRTYRFHD